MPKKPRKISVTDSRSKYAAARKRAQAKGPDAYSAFPTYSKWAAMQGHLITNMTQKRRGK